MACASSDEVPSSTLSEWMWNESVDPFTSSLEWKKYSDVENMIIEEAYLAGKPHAMLDNYHVNFKHKIQISNSDGSKQRQVKRIARDTNDGNVREERFTFTPLNPKRPFSGLYGWISPFIKETAKHLGIDKDHLPSKNDSKVPMIVEKAAAGIIEESKLLGRKCEGEKMAGLLMRKKQAGMKEVWKLCAHLYSLESFLYKKINEIMRLIGDPEHEQEWLNKVPTFGPFCLLLWDNPFENRSIKKGTILYRGANLTDDLINVFKEECQKDEKVLRSFQAFTSCTRNRAKTVRFGNVLFIMTIKHAFTVDLKPFSRFPGEEEELLSPGACFIVNRVEFDEKENKYLVYLDVMQQHSRKDAAEISIYKDSLHDDDARLDAHLLDPGIVRAARRASRLVGLTGVAAALDVAILDDDAALNRVRDDGNSRAGTSNTWR